MTEPSEWNCTSLKKKEEKKKPFRSPKINTLHYVRSTQISFFFFFFTLASNTKQSQTSSKKHSSSNGVHLRSSPSTCVLSGTHSISQTHEAQKLVQTSIIRFDCAVRTGRSQNKLTIELCFLASLPSTMKTAAPKLFKFLAPYFLATAEGAL